MIQNESYTFDRGQIVQTYYYRLVTGLYTYTYVKYYDFYRNYAPKLIDINVETQPLYL